MRARFCVCHRDVRDAVHGEGVIEAAVVVQDAAVPVGRVLAEADIGYDEEVGEGAAEKADSRDNGALRVVCCGSQGVFGGGRERDAEEDDGFQALGYERGEEGDELVGAHASLAGETGDERAFVRVVGDEERVDEHALGELALGLPGARERVRVAAMELGGDFAGDADAGRGGGGVGAGAGDLGAGVGRAGGGGGVGWRGAEGVAVGEVGHEGGEGHGGGGGGCVRSTVWFSTPVADIYFS